MFLIDLVELLVLALVKLLFVVVAVVWLWAPNSMGSVELLDSCTVDLESYRMRWAFREYTVVGMVDNMDVDNSVPRMYSAGIFGWDDSHAPAAVIEAAAVNYGTHFGLTYYIGVLHYAVLIDAASSHLVVVVVVVAAVAVDLIESDSVVVAWVVYQPVADKYVVGIVDIQHRRHFFA